MIQVYNFLGSWQLFPEKGVYESGDRPKSGIYTIEAKENRHQLSISHNWVSIENRGYSSQYGLLADGELHPFENNELADAVQVVFNDSISFEIHFYRGGQVHLHLVHEIMPNG